MFGLEKKTLIVASAGVLLAVLPMLGFNFWINGLIDREGRDNVATSASRTIAITEARIGQVLATLAQLAGQGVDSCSEEHLEILRRAAFRTAPIKEISIVGPEGKTSCTDVGIPLGTRQSISSKQTAASGENIIEVIRIAENDDQMVRVRRMESNDKGLAALIPANLLLPQSSSQGGPFRSHARITAGDGTLIVEGGSQAPENMSANDMFIAQVQSAKYGIQVSVSAPKSLLLANSRHLDNLRWGLNVIFMIALIGLGAFAFWWRQQNPITEIERGFSAKEFVPYYQPLVDIKSGRIIGAEVLIRWRKADGTIVLPGAFIPLVEQLGLIMEMTSELMQNVRDEVGQAIGSRPRLKISFNLAARHFLDDIIVERVRAIFAGSPIRFSQIVLEVTERQPLDNLTATRRVIASLQGLGCKVALDDVGTGHNGLSHILKLGIDIIKIDKLFVDAIGMEHDSATIIETLVDLAQNMRMEIVAEGVENFDQVIYLRDHGVRAAQGYVFSPALPGASFLQLLDAIDPLPASAAKEAASSALNYLPTSHQHHGAA